MLPYERNILNVLKSPVIASSVTACAKHLGVSGNFKTAYYGKEDYHSMVDVCVLRNQQSMVFDYNFERFHTCMCSDAGDSTLHILPSIMIIRLSLL